MNKYTVKKVTYFNIRAFNLLNSDYQINFVMFANCSKTFKSVIRLLQ